MPYPNKTELKNQKQTKNPTNKTKNHQRTQNTKQKASKWPFPLTPEQWTFRSFRFLQWVVSLAGHSAYTAQLLLQQQKISQVIL